MRFLKALFWLFVGLLVGMFIFENRAEEVTIHISNDDALVMKLPTLVILVFLVSFLPTFLIHRARIWSLKRRLENQPQIHVANAPGAPVRNAPVDAVQPEA